MCGGSFHPATSLWLIISPFLTQGLGSVFLLKHKAEIFSQLQNYFCHWSGWNCLGFWRLDFWRAARIFPCFMNRLAGCFPAVWVGVKCRTGKKLNGLLTHWWSRSRWWMEIEAGWFGDHRDWLTQFPLQHQFLSVFNRDTVVFPF